MARSKYRQDTYILNDYSGNTLKARDRVSLKTGKRSPPRFTMDIDAEPLLVDLNTVALGAGPAKAIRDLVQDQIVNINEDASDATIEYRKSARTAYMRGERWATKRYKALRGSREPARPPGSTTKLFNDSRRLAHGIAVRQNTKDGTFTINIPASRDFAGGQTWMHQRLVELVPALTPARLIGDPAFEKAVSEAVDHAIDKALNQNQIRLLQQKHARWRAAQQLIGLVRSLGALGA